MFEKRLCGCCSGANEIFIGGTESDIKYIENYLSNIRALDPIEIAILPNPINLASINSNILNEIIDVGLFRRSIDFCFKLCREIYAVKIYPIKDDRYYIAQPPDDDIGGFYSSHILGYQYWYHAAFVVVLNSRVADKKLRTIELVRGVLHDYLHHSTFRSFKRAIRMPSISSKIAKHRIPEIYREQYGINFRNQGGLSYSSVSLTCQSPETINLNLLMDGVIILIVADLIKRFCDSYAFGNKSEIEKEILKEIILDQFDASILPSAFNFYKEIIEPTKLFIDRWGGQDFMVLILQAMISGELSKLKKFFEKETGIINAWEKKFKRLNFNLPFSF
ncbi:hypothetical protein HZC33_01500 [Candidatus Wolfebacteria bacterium]|nr:hypothetical protein [Candidatus Wolfebacteria bacterium]